jgi:membrane associated rhomboid family serine protease
MPEPVLTYALIALNVAISLWGFSSLRSGSFRRFVFAPHEVMRGKNLLGMLLSHFSHGDGWHLFFNMLTLYVFGRVTEAGLGPRMLIVYAAGAVASNLLILLLRRNDPGYRVLGASDSVTAILFAAIVLRPEMSVQFLVIPIPIPAPIFAVLYIAYTSFLLDRGIGNVSHEGHLAGAISGLLLGGWLAPEHFGPLIDRAQRLFH